MNKTETGRGKRMDNKPLGGINHAYLVCCMPSGFSIVPEHYRHLIKTGYLNEWLLCIG